MAFIEISDLNAAGNDLFLGADSFLNEIGQADSRQIFGGSRGRGSRTPTQSSIIITPPPATHNNCCCHTKITPPPNPEFTPSRPSGGRRPNR